MTYSPNEEFALQLDAADPLRRFRDRFHIPTDTTGRPLLYFVGNSLGLMPKATRAVVEQELEDWARLGVDGHLDGRTPWYSYHETVREPLARLVGAQPHEVVAMNSLTVNLHLMMATFYRPTSSRFKILMEEPAFPSDTYAIKSQITHYGRDPQEALLLARPREGEFTLHHDDVEALLDEHGDQIALVLLGGVNFFTGQLFDIARLTAAAQKHGCTVGIDLAHAVGNVPLQLHDWDVDFAVWCSYKYLNSGPGAVAGAFVHERHATNRSLPRLAGWWGNDPATRFRMHLEPEFIPVPSADSWALSNPPILSLAPLRSSFAIFDEAGGMSALREKSVQLTGYLQFLLDRAPSKLYTVITLREPTERGCQLSILAHEHPKELFAKLEAADVKCDFREPNVVRAAPTPLYNTFHEVWRFADLLAQHQTAA
ncbi:MAG: kynureninase [Chthoniobacterales bacterium]|nr:kynureninase [Chthoniobacterales bacterium]